MSCLFKSSKVYDKSEICSNMSTEMGIFDAGLGKCPGENDEANLSADQVLQYVGSETGNELVTKQIITEEDGTSFEEHAAARSVRKMKFDDKTVSSLHMESDSNLGLLKDNPDNEQAMDEQDNVLQGALEKLSFDSATPECKYECASPDEGVLPLMKSEGSLPELTVSMREDDSLKINLHDSLKIELHGRLLILLPNVDDRFVKLQFHREVIPGLNFTMHPNIDKDLFMNERIVKFKDPNRNLNGHTEVIRWTSKMMDEDSLPLKVQWCDWDWPEEGKKATLDYTTQSDLVLENVTIDIYLPRDFGTAMVEKKTGGDHKWDYGRERLACYLPCVQPHTSGFIRIVEAGPEPWSCHFPYLEPVNVQFETSDSFSGFKVACASSTYVEKISGTAHYLSVYALGEFHEYLWTMKAYECQIVDEWWADDDWGEDWPAVNEPN